MRPIVSPNCAGARTDPLTSRRLPCLPCTGSGIVYIPGHDEWAGYRSAYDVTVTPQCLAMEESLDEAGLGRS